MAARGRPRSLGRPRRLSHFALALTLAAGVFGVVDLAGGPSGAAAAKAAKPRALDPSYFATGSCMSLPPTKGNRHTTVFLDAGHGGVDPGGMGQTENGKSISEATLNLPIELDAASALRADGFTVAVSRTSDTTVLRLGAADLDGRLLTLVGTHDDTAARDVCANKSRASLLVGIYFDASSSSDTAGSLTAFDESRPFAADNAHFAQLLQTDVLHAMNAKGWQIPDDGVVSDSGLGSVPPADDPETGLAAKAAAYDHLMLLGPAESGYFDTPSRMPGALIEPLYLTDPFEGSVADSAVGQKTIAGGIATAVRAYFAKPKSGGTGVPSGV